MINTGKFTIEKFSLAKYSCNLDKDKLHNSKFHLCCIDEVIEPYLSTLDFRLQLQPCYSFPLAVITCIRTWLLSGNWTYDVSLYVFLSKRSILELKKFVNYFASWVVIWLFVNLKIKNNFFLKSLQKATLDATG